MAEPDIWDYVHKLFMKKILFHYDSNDKVFYYSRWELDDDSLEAVHKLINNYAESNGIRPDEIKIVKAEWDMKEKIYNMYK